MTEEMLLGWFPEGIHVAQIKDKGTTGNFEVTVDGRLVHSKKTQGQGFFETAPAERQDAVKAAIAEALQGADDKKASVGDITSGSVKASGGGCSVM